MKKALIATLLLLATHSISALTFAQWIKGDYPTDKQVRAVLTELVREQPEFISIAHYGA